MAKISRMAGYILSVAVVMVCQSSGCTSLQMLTFNNQEKIMFESYRENVMEIVDDPGRADQLIEIGEDLALALHAYADQLTRLAKKVIKANVDYDIAPEELLRHYQAFDACRRNMRESVMQARRKTVALTTEKEWQRLYNRKNSLREMLEQKPGLF